MIEKLSMTFDLAGVMGATALPVLQNFNISIISNQRKQKLRLMRLFIHGLLC